MAVDYSLSQPLSGMTAYNSSSFQMMAAVTASTFAANTTGKLYLTAELSATLAGVAISLNAPAVLAIEAVNSFKAEWNDGKFKFSGTVAEEEGAAAKAAMQQTESALATLQANVSALKTKATELGNHGATLRLYATLMEG